MHVVIIFASVLLFASSVWRMRYVLLRPVRGALFFLSAVLTFLGMPVLAFAGTAASSTSIDITMVTNILLSVVSVVVLALIKPVWSFLAAHMMIGQSSALYAQGLAEIEGLGQLAISEMTSVAAHNPTLALPAAVANIITKAEPAALTACTALGWAPEVISARISGWVIKELGLIPATAAPAADPAPASPVTPPSA